MTKQRPNRLEVPVILYGQGACIGAERNLFFSEKPELIDRAKQICGVCAVRAVCLEFALSTLEDNGTWGGASEAERRIMRRRRRQAKNTSVA